MGTTQPNNLVVKSYSEDSGQRFKSRSILRHSLKSGLLCSNGVLRHLQAAITREPTEAFLNENDLYLCGPVCVCGTLTGISCSAFNQMKVALPGINAANAVSNGKRQTCKSADSQRKGHTIYSVNALMRLMLQIS